MTKFLVVGFKNAGLFRKHRNTKDKTFDMFGRGNRKDLLEFVEPITVHQISNMLHVLFGERPKPINRETVYDKIPYLFEKALSSYLKIETYKNEKGNFPSENIQTKKSVSNSTNPVSYMNWNRVKALLEPELFAKFVSVVEEVLSIKVDDVKFNDVRKILQQTKDVRLDELFNFLILNKKKKIYDAIYGSGNEIIGINADDRTKLTVLSGLDRIIRLSGEIIIPVTDDDITKIKNNKGCATILDGGLVFIKGVKSGNVINVDNHIKISEISLEKQ